MTLAPPADVADDRTGPAFAGDKAPIAAAIGRAAAGGFAVAGRLRRTTKPLHPRGAVITGTLTRLGLDEPTGVPWLDEPGHDEVIVRLSRSAGLPSRLPDVLGLALRVPLAGGHADLLFSTGGSGPVSRFLLVPRRRPENATYSTLVPFRTPTGGVVLSAVAERGASSLCFELRVAALRGQWRTFARLELPDDQTADDTYVAFDAVANPVPGLEPYAWVRELRAGAYRAARRSRGDDRAAP